MKRLCKGCGQEKTCIDTGRVRRKDRSATWHEDEHGALWDYTTHCPDCRKQRQTKRDRVVGKHKHIDSVTDKAIVLGRESEKKAETFFRDLGFQTQLNQKTHGPDLIIQKDQEIKTVEVKTVGKRGYSLIVNRVTEKRKADDLIAYVYGNNILILPMPEHLANCDKTGVRTITKLVRDQWKL